MLTVEQASAQILAHIAPALPETVSLEDALGCVLAEDIAADLDAPPFDNSAVDGYAVLANEITAASPQNPITLRMVAEIHAGMMPTLPLLSGTTTKIMTGAPVPPQADAIVMREDTTADTDGNIQILEAAERGQHIRQAGEMWRTGEVVLQRGTPLHASEIGLLASLGRPMVPVFRRPRVAVLSTGDEIVPVTQAGEIPPPGKLRDSNQPMLAALVREAGAILHSATHIPDDYAITVETLRRLADPEHGADMIVTAGGVSVGDKDYIKPALEELGTLDLWRVAMKPGKPLAFGRIGRTLFFGLPGNPVSAFVTFELFVRPALLQFTGCDEASHARPMVQAVLTEDVPHTPGRREYLRAVTITDGTSFQTRPIGSQSSGVLRSVSRANSLLIVPETDGNLAAGTHVTVLLLSA